jgi:hypothetical protein
VEVEAARGETRAAGGDQIHALAVYPSRFRVPEVVRDRDPADLEAERRDQALHQIGKRGIAIARREGGIGRNESRQVADDRRLVVRDEVPGFRERVGVSYVRQGGALRLAGYLDINYIVI